MPNFIIKNLRNCSAILIFSLLLTMPVLAQTCGTPPTCISLGYTQKASECANPNKALKCPFDTSQVFCKEDAQTIEIGAILYSDKSITNNVITGKTPIGIVFDTDQRLAVALEQSSSTLKWGEGGTFVSNLIRCDAASDNTPADCSKDGKANTAAIIAYGKAHGLSYPAAEYCNKYKTEGTQAGNWFLPSFQELTRIYNRKNIINASLKLLNKDTIPETYYWSSNQNNASHSWEISILNGKGLIDPKSYPSNVLPIIAF